MAANLIADNAVMNKLNETLKKLPDSRGYKVIKVLILYWEDGDEGFKEEGRAVRRVFEDVLNYLVHEYPIPSETSYFHLLNTMKNVFTTETDLLIIHYGGHAGKDKDEAMGEKRRSVWFAHTESGPRLNWYKIQKQIAHSENDILLLLDCCYAAQAARVPAPLGVGGRFDILAASAMSVPAVGPGPSSFTSVLLAEIRAMVDSEGSVDVKDLHTILCAWHQPLRTTPVYTGLKPGQQPIRLKPQPLSEPPSRHMEDQGECYSLRLNIQIREGINAENAGQIPQWLRTDMPPMVSGVEVDQEPQGEAHEDELHREVRQYNPQTMLKKEHATITTRIKHLTKLLGEAKAAAAFRSLQCIGYFETPSRYRYTLLFSIPEDLRPDFISLNQLIGNHPILSTDFRRRLARSLTQAVHEWHRHDLVHRDINSHRIYFFGINGDPGYSEDPFLQGFEFDDSSVDRALVGPEFDAYRHPERGVRTRKMHNQKHDIYSLGIVLLEIGLWRNVRSLLPVLQLDSDRRVMAEPLWKRCQEWLANSDVPGPVYQAVVQRCLRFDFLSSSSDGRVDGGEFWEKVVHQLG
ncbi:hypothetical protein QBC39DRAFT_99206 [Podospora conica]|nr:hypothetical protein QBC39DRAFT_99206 [Schizothecium conicum]